MAPEWLTRKLWGVASEAPFLHHGRATLLSEAILLHGGEAEPQRLAYEALSSDDQAAIVEFIKTLQILPEDAGRVIVDGGASVTDGDGLGIAAMGVIGGVVGGAFLLLVAFVALALARRRRNAAA